MSIQTEISNLIYYSHIVLSYTIERFAMYVIVGHTLYDLYNYVFVPFYKKIQPYEYTILCYVYAGVCVIKTIVLISLMHEIMKDLENYRKRKEAEKLAASPELPKEQ